MRGRRVRDAEPRGLDSEHALRAAYAAHGAELYRFALRQLGDDGAAQDVVQEVFLRAWRRADSYDPSIASLRVWLFALARNAVIDEVRRVAVRPWRRGLVGEVEADARTGSVDAAEHALVDTWLVEEALRRIREEHRTAIVQTYLRGRPYAEVAAELGIPVGTLRSRVFYGLKALRLAMDEMGVEP
ncbi:sigma-70 family RNA polymerase sigma factor [Pseudonocardia sichuanensis]|uniref:RNA polymerase sigma-70 factor (ECF subfamily) n=1 Tax=Pseudonocardia kunmingensis TaxID=630975 RepID=A0A543DK26_9PSEU|nr:sigma-70 family RNA polymerase sigma factor [Pseudonocardia kunmingensis]TQM09595.1 RNA polymerase sigma-70 factor (ECF subfamily) [Pseudonocardia kunmingensis]